MNSDGNQISNSNEEDFEVRRGPWTLEEDNLLIHNIACHGQGSWNSLAKCAGLKRTGKSCRLRWLNYLKPDVKRGNLSPEEQLTILELHSRWGNRWSKIAQHLPGRTDNEIKNYWRTRVQKQARQLKVDANSKTFLEAIRCFWMPRLLEKMEQQQSSSTSTSSSSSSISTKKKQDSTIGSLQNNHSILAPSSSLEPRKLQETSITQKGKSLTSNVSSTCEYHNGNSNTIQDSRYDSRFENLGYNTEWYSQQAMSATGSQDLLLSEYLMPEVDMFNDELGGAFWNTDELWKAGT